MIKTGFTQAGSLGRQRGWKGMFCEMQNNGAIVGVLVHEKKGINTGKSGQRVGWGGKQIPMCLCTKKQNRKPWDLFPQQLHKLSLSSQEGGIEEEEGKKTITDTQKNNLRFRRHAWSIRKGRSRGKGRKTWRSRLTEFSVPFGASIHGTTKSPRGGKEKKRTEKIQRCSVTGESPEGRHANKKQIVVSMAVLKEEEQGFGTGRRKERGELGGGG